MNSMPQMLICNHINLHRKAECNTDVILYADHLLKCYHINQYGVALGLEAFAPDFNYNYKNRDSSVERAPADDILAQDDPKNITTPQYYIYSYQNDSIDFMTNTIFC